MSGPSLPVRLAWNVYERLPLDAGDALDRALHRVAARSPRPLPLVRIAGTHPRTGAATSVVVVDPAPSVDHFLTSLVGPEPRREPLGDVAPADVSRALDALAADATLLVARLHRERGRRHLPADWIRLPESVNVWMPVPDEGLVGERARKSQSDNLRRIRANDLRARITRAMADFDRFYHDMYVPYVRLRHGPSAYVTRYHRLRRAMRHGGIMWILHEGRPILAELYCLRPPVLQWVCKGAPGGDRALAYGASSACYVLGVPYARRWGVHRFDMGDCRPSLTDGVLRHKVRWGGRLRPSSRAHRDLLIRWPRPSEEIAWWIAGNQPVAREGRDLVALTAVSPETGRVPAAIRAPGIARTRTVAL